jgi:hypothetical protein
MSYRPDPITATFGAFDLQALVAAVARRRARRTPGGSLYGPGAQDDPSFVRFCVGAGTRAAEAVALLADELLHARIGLAA